MSTLPLLILATTAIFVAGIVVQNITRVKFCAVCVAISSTWIILLGLRLLGYAINPAIIGVLMGESVVGLYYLLEKKLPPAWQLFRWPTLITMTVIAYLIVGIRGGAVRAIMSLALIWIAFGVIHSFRHYAAIKKITERIIACCRDW